MGQKRRKHTTNCESLDIVEAAHSDKLYPLMYCHMELDRCPDMERLKAAIAQSCQYVPEILYTYDFQRGRFVDQGFSVDSVVIAGSDDSEKALHHDLSKSPQLKITVGTEGQQNTVTFCMSHILTDGAGFLEYLYLLASLYSGDALDRPLSNSRDITPLLMNIRVGLPTQQAREGKKIVVPALRPHSNGTQHHCLKTVLASGDFEVIRTKAKQYGATLNSVFIAAYARVIAHMHNMEKIVVPCPADLRRFGSMPDGLTVANMTGVYKRVIVEVKPRDVFISTLMQVQIEMALQKFRNRCFSGIRLLDFAFGKVPYPILKSATKEIYQLPPVSYTNIGVIDDVKLHFKGFHITNCFVAGTYRLSPDFQLTVSTFRNQCTLNCALIGDSCDKQHGQRILEQVKEELRRWIQE